MAVVCRTPRKRRTTFLSISCLMFFSRELENVSRIPDDAARSKPNVILESFVLFNVLSSTFEIERDIDELIEDIDHVLKYVCNKS